MESQAEEDNFETTSSGREKRTRANQPFMLSTVVQVSEDAIKNNEYALQCSEADDDPSINGPIQ